MNKIDMKNSKVEKNAISYIKMLASKFDEKPTLAILDPSPDKASASYISGIKKDFEMFNLGEPTVIIGVGSCMDFLNSNNKDQYTGIICVSDSFFQRYFRKAIPVSKDIEGVAGNDKVIPSTALAIFKHIHGYFDYKFLEGKNVCIINRSATIGIPLQKLLMTNNCTVTIMHSHTTLETKHLLCPNMDIIVTATGVPGSFDQYMVSSSKNQLIIDIGMGLDENDKIHGDISDDAIANNKKGFYINYRDIGRCTRLCLIENLLTVSDYN